MSLVVSLGPTMTVSSPSEPSEQTVSSFVVGFFDEAARTSDEGEAWGVQVDLTAAGAFCLLGGQTAELSNRVLDAHLLDRVNLDRLAGGLSESESDAVRLAVLEAALCSVMECGPRLSPQVEWAENCLRSDPNRPIGRLADEVGWRGERLMERFRREVGVTPKTYATVQRFARAAAVLRSASFASFAAVAVDAGYADQAHFNRDFRRFAGCTPSEFAAEARTVG